MTRTQKLIGGALISLLFVAISFFSMCGIRLQRLQNEDDLAALKTSEKADDGTMLDNFEILDQNDGIANQIDPEQKETQALLEKLEASDSMSFENSNDNEAIPDDSMDRLREIVSSEMVTDDAEANDHTSQIDSLVQQFQTDAGSNVAELDSFEDSSGTSSDGEITVPEELSNFSFQPKSLTLKNPTVPVTTKKDNDFYAYYQDALDEFYAHRYRRAIDKFRKLLLRNDAGDLADNCQYWIGESYFAMGDFYQAIAEFEKVYIYSNGNKVADAQLMVGVALMKIGRKKQAKSEFSLVMALFKNKSTTQKARHYLRLIERV